MQTSRVPRDITVLAPDGSEIRELLAVSRGSMVHCQLPPGGVSMAVRHRTVEEVWFFLQGRGQVWRKKDDQEMVVDVEPGVSVNIETGTDFQFRNAGADDLTFIIVTMPPWSGDDEGVRVADYWKVE